MSIIRPRRFTRDNSPFMYGQNGNPLSSGMTFDRATIDATGAFLNSELERLDPSIHEPLVAVSWSRDIDLREDVTIADEVSSFTNSTFAAAGGIVPNGKSWIGKNSNQIAGMQLDIGKTGQPLRLWGEELSFTIPELESAMKLGRPVDTQKLDGIQLKHQMDIDEMVYIGDSFLNVFGLTNSPLVTAANVVNGAASSPHWALKTADEILADVNTLLNRVWAASGWAVMPSELRLPPAEYSLLVSMKVSDAGNISVLEFLRNNSLSNTANGRPLNIQPVKWLIGRGAGATDRMMAYTKDKKRVRYPMTPLQRTQIEYRSIWQATTYFCRLGQMEFVYPETLGYSDGIG